MLLITKPNQRIYLHLFSIHLTNQAQHSFPVHVCVCCLRQERDSFYSLRSSSGDKNLGKDTHAANLVVLFPHWKCHTVDCVLCSSREIYSVVPSTTATQTHTHVLMYIRQVHATGWPGKKGCVEWMSESASESAFLTNQEKHIHPTNIQPLLHSLKPLVEPEPPPLTRHFSLWRFSTSIQKSKVFRWATAQLTREEETKLFYCGGWSLWCRVVEWQDKIHITHQRTKNWGVLAWMTSDSFSSPNFEGYLEEGRVISLS